MAEGLRKSSNTPTIFVGLLLVVLGFAGYYIERAHAVENPDSAGFGVRWDHQLHSGLGEFNCQVCHMDSKAGQSRLEACDECHIRQPARELGDPPRQRIVVSFSPEADEGADQPPNITAARAVEGLSKVIRVARVFDDHLLADVAIARDGDLDGLMESISGELARSVSAINGVRVSHLANQRETLHQTCIGCHGAVSEGPTECVDCHAGNRGNVSCGSCHGDTYAQLNSKAHQLVGCVSCHTDLEENAATDGAHPRAVPKMGDRADCLTCHCLNEVDDDCSATADPFKRRFVRREQLPRNRAKAYQAHMPEWHQDENDE